MSSASAKANVAKHGAKPLKLRRINRARFQATPISAFNFPLTIVVSPDPDDPNSAFDYAWDAQDHLLIKVVFSWPIDTGSVIPRRTLILHTTKDHNADGTITWSADRTAFLFKTIKAANDLILPAPDDSFSLTLIGSDLKSNTLLRRGIRDDFGLLIDGDYNGHEGGNYKASFTIIG